MKYAGKKTDGKSSLLPVQFMPYMVTRLHEFGLYIIFNTKIYKQKYTCNFNRYRVSHANIQLLIHVHNESEN